MSEAHIIALVRPIAKIVSDLTFEERVTLFTGLLAQEICSLPPSDRAAALTAIQRDLPMILDATETGMRRALVDNAQAGI